MNKITLCFNKNSTKTNETEEKDEKAAKTQRNNERKKTTTRRSGGWGWRGRGGEGERSGGVLLVTRTKASGRKTSREMEIWESRKMRAKVFMRLQPGTKNGQIKVPLFIRYIRLTFGVHTMQAGSVNICKDCLGYGLSTHQKLDFRKEKTWFLSLYWAVKSLFPLVWLNHTSNRSSAELQVFSLT